MKTYRVTYIGKSRGTHGTISYLIKAETPQDAVRDSRKFASVECPGWVMKGVIEVKEAA